MWTIAKRGKDACLHINDRKTKKKGRKGKDVPAFVPFKPDGNTEQDINSKLDLLSKYINSLQKTKIKGESKPLCWDLCTFCTTTVEGSRPDGVAYDESRTVQDQFSHLAYFELKKPKVSLSDATKGRTDLRATCLA